MNTPRILVIEDGRPRPDAARTDPRQHDRAQVVELKVPSRRSALRRLAKLGGLLLTMTLPWLPPAHAGGASAPVPLRIAVDPGHTPAQGGALGIRGLREVHYNDAFAARLCAALQAAGFQTLLTRAPDQEMNLAARAERANAWHADLFLAIHHDSAQPQYLEKIQAGTLEAYRTRQPIAGYSLFVSRRNAQFPRSYAFAERLGDAMHALGRAPALHHAEPIPGENRALLDRQRGIYGFDDLVVLRKAEMPAVLLEVGVIVDAGDEAYVSNEGHQQRMVGAIVKAMRAYAADDTAKP